MKGNNTEKPLVSVIVPVYGVERYLRQCLDSIVGQTYENLEILVIDDGSTDRSGVIADEYARKDQRVQVIHQKNAGSSAARNAGLDRATGRYLAFVDGDDWLAAGTVERLIGAAEETGADLVVFDNFRAVENSGAPLQEQYWFDAPRTFSNGEIMAELLADRLGSQSWNKFCRAELFAGVRYPIGIDFAEDIFTLYKAVSQAKQAVYLHECLYYYRIRPASLSYAAPDINMVNLFRAFRERYDFAQTMYPQCAADCLRLASMAGMNLYHAGISGANRRADETVRQEVLDFLKAYRTGLAKAGLSWERRAAIGLMTRWEGLYSFLYRLLKKGRG